MSLVSPKPIIVQVIRTEKVSPGMTFALVEDVEKRLWVVESCPAGTQFWTLVQASELPRGARTRRALQEILREGRKREQEKAMAHPLRNRESAPKETRQLAEAESPLNQRVCVRPLRSAPEKKTLLGV